MNSIWTAAFWKAATERAVKSAAQALLIVWGFGDGLLNVFALDWTEALGVALGMALASYLFSVLSSGRSGGPSLGDAEVLNPAPAPPPANG